MTKTEYIDILTEIELLKLALKLEDCCDVKEKIQEELEELEKKL